jgi:hypothetical protein
MLDRAQFRVHEVDEDCLPLRSFGPLVSLDLLGRAESLRHAPVYNIAKIVEAARLDVDED